MTITVQKQVEETLEVKTPCYYKGLTGYHFINQAGQLITVSDRMITLWEAKDGKYRNEDIERIVRTGQPCSKEAFDLKYAEALAKLEAAVECKDLSAQQSFIAEASAAEGLGALAE